MKLLGSTNSPFVRKVRVVLIEKELRFELLPTDIWRGPEIFQFNPMGKIPCLITDAGEALFDSSVIVQYLELLGSGVKLLPDGGMDRIEVLLWESLADGLLDALTSARMEMTFAGRDDTQRNQAWIDRQMSKAISVLAHMETRLASRRWCAGGQLSLADLASASALSYLDFRFSALDWRASYPGLAGLHERLSGRPCFMQTQPTL
jgi:glutathione S-transferase